MRVAVYHNILWPKYKGAIFSELHELGREAGLEISFVQIAETEGERAALGKVDLSYHRYPYRLLFNGAYSVVPMRKRVFALLRDLLRYPAELVVIPGYDRPEYWMMLLVCIVTRRRRAVFCDSTLYDRMRTSWKESAKRWFFSRCDGVFGYGIRSKEYLMTYGVTEEKIRFRCQAAALPPSYDVTAVRAAYQTQPDRAATLPKFLYVGRLSVEKGLMDLLQALSRFRETQGDATLDLVGAGSQEQHLAAEAERLGLENLVRFLGPKNMEDIAGLLVSSVALVLPSRSEPWGLVVNEALSYGCPVLVSNVCGCVPELVIDGVTGYSFEAGNINALCDRMSAAVALSLNRSGVAEHCMRLIAEFTPRHAAAEILAGCTHMLAENP